MREAKLYTARMGGTWRAVLIGRSDGSVFGTRLHVLKRQNRRGYGTRDEAIRFATSALGVLLDRLPRYASKCGDGQFVSTAKLRTLDAEEVTAGGLISPDPKRGEWSKLPMANLYAAGMAAKAYVEKSIEIARLQVEQEQAYASLASAVGRESAEKMIAGMRAENP